MEFSKRRLEKILEPYINDNLECDGQSKVISYILTKNGIDHKLYDGELVDKESGEGIYHQWIEIDNNLIVDYKARMWYPDSDCWHGIFEKSKMNNRELEYTQPKSMGTPKISDMIFNILCSEGKTMKLADTAKKILNEAPDINDPRLMALRAKKDQIQSYGKKPSAGDISRWYEALDKLYGRLKGIVELEKETFSEMENDPGIELEGGPVADGYGDKLNKLDTLKQKVLSKIKEYNDKINKYKEVFLRR